MTKEHAYAYEAGYVDGSTHYELEHCPACKNVADLQATLDENAKLREQMERLVTLLRVDCDIDASWDGLRRFWSIGLTEDGCLMRDRACKAEAENAKLRELAADMWNEGMCECGSRGKCARCEYGYPDRMRELGVDA